MNALERHIEEIIRYQDIMNKTRSVPLRNDCGKHIYRLKKELKEYCYYRDYNFKEILKNYGL